MEKADQAHHVFRHVKPCFTLDDPDKLKQWFDKHKKKFLEHHIPESDSDAIYYVELFCFINLFINFIEYRTIQLLTNVTTSARCKLLIFTGNLIKVTK